MSSPYGVDLVRPITYEGITQWSDMAGEMEKDLPRLVDELRQTLATEPWGSGAEGKAFYANHYQGDGPTKLMDRCSNFPQQFADAGDRVREGVENLFTTDTTIAYDIGTGERVREV
ncbi:hypothetical protein [Nonomuraea sp. NPDC003804]|uniref:hypothetical protein n=1 Tax=Nonomuraea sp. NPDC003804 TaxID=3154547 RepID=UPI0033BA8314